MSQRMTFTETFARQIDATSAYYFEAGHTYDVPDEILSEVAAAGVAAPAVEAAPDATR